MSEQVDKQADKPSYGFSLALPLYRQGPWVSDCDGGWIAHRSLPLFKRLHSLCPTTGWWVFDDNGVRERPDYNIMKRDLVNKMASFAVLVSGSDTRTVIEPYDTPSHPTIDEAVDYAAEFVDVRQALTPDGESVAFNAQLMFASEVGDTIVSWHLVNDNGWTLVGCGAGRAPLYAQAAMTINPPANN